MSQVCTRCKNSHNDRLKNGSFFKTCLNCRVDDVTQRQEKLKVDKNGLQGCRRCYERFTPGDFPNSLKRNKKSTMCSVCLRLKKEQSDVKYSPYRSQVEEYRKRNPHCAETGHIIEDGDDHFDHIPERGNKIKKVTDYGFWSSSLAGKTNTERLKLHKEELEKCERVCTACHKKRTNRRLGELSTHPRAAETQKRVAMIVEENWEYIKNIQGGKCGCKCGEVLLKGIQAVEFDHERGEKLFNMAHAHSHSKKDRALERSKGSFKLSHHHRELTKKRRFESHEDRNNKITKIY